MTYAKNILFLDIETAALYPDYKLIPKAEQELWESKSQYLRDREVLSPEECYYKKAAIYAEFAKVICISIGVLYDGENGVTWKQKTLLDQESEVSILDKFSVILEKLINFKICGHNCKEFDLPFLARRFLIQGLPLPKFLAALQGKKPWQAANVIDTMELWKFGDIKNYTSLSLLAYLLGEPSPKEDISGADIHNVYWQNGDMERIKTYCEKDVYTTAKIYFKLTAQPIDF